MLIVYPHNFGLEGYEVKTIRNGKLFFLTFDAAGSERRIKPVYKNNWYSNLSQNSGLFRITTNQTGHGLG